MFARVARADRAQDRARQRLRAKLIRNVVEIYIEVIEGGDEVCKELLDPSKVMMELMSRAEQIEMLSGILRGVSERDRDDALELICALLPYAKPRSNAPRGEIAGVSMFNSVVRKSGGSAR